MMSDGLRDEVRVRVLADDGEGAAIATSERLRDGAFRLKLCMGLFAAVFSVLILRLGYVSFGMNEELTSIRAEIEQPERRGVVDMNGRPLIMNRPGIGLAVDGRDVWDNAEVVEKLGALFPDIDQDRLAARLERDQYSLLLSHLTEAERQEAVATGLPGLRFPPMMARAYPQGDLAAHVVGYTIPGQGGAVGVERVLDQASALSEEPLRLTIDIVSQEILEDELRSAMRRFGAEAAWGVLLHAPTGEVRAMASLPDYNPNRPGAAVEGGWRNRVMSEVYELGSAFKPITAAMAIDRGVVTLTEEFAVDQALDVGGWRIDDLSRKAGPLTVSEIVQYSSNIGTVRIVQRLGAEMFVEGLAQLGLTTALETDLPARRAPLVSEEWRPSELATSSYGHGIAITPLQLTAAFAAVVNGGTYRVPHFLAGDHDEGSEAFSASTSAQMRIVLRRSVTDGTGRPADVPGYYVIGKTATADKPGVGGYTQDGPLISSFIGAFPGYDPEYVLLVSVDEPRSSGDARGAVTANIVAAPIFRRVVERAAPALGIMPVGDDVAFDGFIGARLDLPESPGVQLDELASLLSEAAY